VIVTGGRFGGKILEAEIGGCHRRIQKMADVSEEPDTGMGKRTARYGNFLLTIKMTNDAKNVCKQVKFIK